VHCSKETTQAVTVSAWRQAKNAPRFSAQGVLMSVLGDNGHQLVIVLAGVTADACPL